MTKIIALSGKKQSGKTTSCEYIASITKVSHKIYSFADPLKQDICIKILGLSYDQCYGSDEEKNQPTHITWNDKNLSAREVMQVVGTEIFRSMYPNVWVNALITKIRDEGVDVALISDCRFPNEVDIVQQSGGMVVRLTRDPFSSDHPSERALDPDNYDWSIFDYIIYNNDCNLEVKNQMLQQYLSECDCSMNPSELFDL